MRVGSLVLGAVATATGFVVARAVAIVTTLFARRALVATVL